MDLNRVEGSVKNLAGKAEEAYGEATEDPSRQSSGRARQLAGDVQNVYGQTVDQIRSVGCELSGAVERNPLSSLLIAGAIGYLFAVITRD